MFLQKTAQQHATGKQGETVSLARTVILRYDLLPCAFSASGLLIHMCKQKKNLHRKPRDKAWQIRGSFCQGAQAISRDLRLLPARSTQGRSGRIAQAGEMWAWQRLPSRAESGTTAPRAPSGRPEPLAQRKPPQPRLPTGPYYLRVHSTRRSRSGSSSPV